MRSFLSHSFSGSFNADTAGRSHGSLSGRSIWRKQAGAVGVFGNTPVSDAEAAQRALLCRSEAFAEDLGPGYDGLRFVASAAAVR